MPRISNEKIKKIEEQIVYHLFNIYPKQVFTFDIAKEVARDEEFIKKRLIELEKQGLVVRINKNCDGIKYERRLRWRISNKAHEAYQKIQ